MQACRKSRLLLDRVNEALTVLKKKPENGERLYQLIYLTYIAPEQTEPYGASVPAGHVLPALLPAP